MQVASYALSHRSKSRRMRTYAKRGEGWGPREGLPFARFQGRRRMSGLQCHTDPPLQTTLHSSLRDSGQAEQEGWGTRKGRTGV